MNVLFFSSSVIKSKGGEGTITICWTLFLKHFRGHEAFLNILGDEFVSTAPQNSNECFSLLQCVGHPHVVPAWNTSHALLPGFPRQQQAILSAVKISPSPWDCHWCLRGSTQGPMGKLTAGCSCSPAFFMERGMYMKKEENCNEIH